MAEVVLYISHVETRKGRRVMEGNFFYIYLNGCDRLREIKIKDNNLLKSILTSSYKTLRPIGMEKN